CYTLILFLFLFLPRPTISTLFPYTTLFRSDSNKIKFLTDVDSDSFVDTIYYYSGSPNELLSTPNPRDRYLYRVVNNEPPAKVNLDRKSTRLNSSHVKISYAVFCLKKKKKNK